MGSNEFLFLLTGLKWTVLLSIVGFIGGGVFGLAIALARTCGHALLERITAGYIALFQGTPLLMQLFVVYYGLALVGLGLWAVGIFFEWVGDWQLARFKADPANRGEVMDRGLWRYTRHPNYFGDACVWWGIWIAAASAGWWVAAATVIGPLFLTFTLTKWSGAPLLEGGMRKSRPGYEDYKARTSAFFPLPPAKSAVTGREGV